MELREASGETVADVRMDRGDVLGKRAPADAAILPNLRVLCGGARYGAPAVQEVFEWD